MIKDFLNDMVDFIFFKSGGKRFQKYEPENDRLVLNRSMRGNGNIRFFELYLSGVFLALYFQFLMC